MNLIEEIRTKLRNYPHVKYVSDASSIRVLPISDDGFTVELYVTHDQYTVSFNGWHEVFNDAAEALDCFGFGLSDLCRLKEYRRGNSAYRWAVESKENGQWVAESETGLLIFPFWKRSEVVYLQNRLFTSDTE